MAGTIRGEAELDALMDHDNTWEIASQTIRDLNATVHANLKARSLPSFGDGVAFGNNAAAAAANTTAIANWAANSEDSLFIPPDPDNVGFYFDAMPLIPRSVYGSGTSGLHAASGFTPVNDTFFDMVNLRITGAQFIGFECNAEGECGYSFGNDQPKTLSGAVGRFEAKHLFILGGTIYQVFHETGLSSPGLGAIYQQCGINGTDGGSLMNIGARADDFSVKQCRFAQLSQPTSTPITIGGSGSPTNVLFDGNFVQNLGDHAVGIASFIALGGTGRGIRWRGSFIELGHVTYTNLKYIFDVNAEASIADVTVEGGLVTLPADSAFVRFNGNSSHQMSLRNCTNPGAVMGSLVALTTGAGGLNKVVISIENCGNASSFTNLITSANDVSTGGAEIAHLVGNHHEDTYDHYIAYDGTNIILTDQRQVVAEVTFGAGTATVATLGVPVKVVATTAQKGAASGITVGTDNTLTTAKPGLRRYRVWGRFLVGVAAATDMLTLHVFVGAASVFETAAQDVTNGSPLLFEIDIVLEIDDAKAIELYAENEDTTANITVAAAAERVDTTPAHGFLRVAQV